MAFCARISTNIDVEDIDKILTIKVSILVILLETSSFLLKKVPF